jgi:hypothetical protein
MRLVDVEVDGDVKGDVEGDGDLDLVVQSYPLHEPRTAVVGSSAAE